jgi:hypothetical protein
LSEVAPADLRSSLWFAFLNSELISCRPLLQFDPMNGAQKLYVGLISNGLFSVPAYKLSNGDGTIIMQLNNRHIRMTFSVNRAVINVSKHVTHWLPLSIPLYNMPRFTCCQNISASTSSGFESDIIHDKFVSYGKLSLPHSSGEYIYYIYIYILYIKFKFKPVSFQKTIWRCESLPLRIN